MTLLAGAKAARGTASAAWSLAEALCDKEPAETGETDLSRYWGSLLAALVLLENKSLRRVTGRNQVKANRIRSWLVQILQQQVLPAVERARAGNALADFGDPRFDPEVWYLPVDDPLWGFVEVPESPFTMGDGDAEQNLYLPRYFISRYPVTVSQFRVFVARTGYPWEHQNRPQEGLHHPAVYVNWQDAMAYCQWLTEQLRHSNAVPEPLKHILGQQEGCVMLPSEAEWEKAARGTDGRLYPWGKDADAELANYEETGIGGTSTVGCFPQGASPYGVEECSGNVWEWTRSIHGAYPYPSDEKGRAERENLQSDGSEGRVLRGGAFNVNASGVRCSIRYVINARDVNLSIGFRVVLSSLP